MTWLEWWSSMSLEERRARRKRCAVMHAEWMRARRRVLFGLLKEEVMIVKCTCGAACRIPSVVTASGVAPARARCPKCQHIFTPMELAKGVNEPPPEQPKHPFLVAMEEAGFDLDEEQEDSDAY